MWRVGRKKGVIYMNNDLQLILEEIRGLKAETCSLREEMRGMETSLREEMRGMETSLREEMKGMETSLREDMKKMETSLRQEIQDGDAAIRLILENDIRPKINILAENHLDLYRKLDEIREELKKNELLPVRVSILEKDVREIKRQQAMSV